MTPLAYGSDLPKECSLVAQWAVLQRDTSVDMHMIGYVVWNDVPIRNVPLPKG